MGELKRIPLIGHRREGMNGRELRGLKTKSSDCDSFAPPTHVNRKHEEIQQMIDRRKVKDGVEYGWVEHDGEKVTDWYVDEELL